MRRLMGWVTGFLMAWGVANVWAMPFAGVYAFGDSLSDSGSSPSAVLSIYKLLGGACDPFHPCPPYYEGRYSNGAVAVERLAGALLPGGAHAGNFFDFAVSGATTGVGNYGDGGSATTPGAYGLPGMAQQVASYLSLSGGAADPGALYFVWGGANDFLTADDPAVAAQNIASYVGLLAAAGATRFFVPNIPDLSVTPFVRSVGMETEAQAFSVGFNGALALQLAGVSVMFPAIDIVQFDTFSFLNSVIQNPGGYGLGNVADACLPSIFSIPCANPDNYLFWDDFHPTTQGHALIASAFAAAVPEPGTWVLLAVGLLALLHAGRPAILARKGLRRR